MLDDAKIAELKEKHGAALVAVQTEDGTVLVFRKPKRIEYDLWFDKRDNGSASARNLAQSCLVFPDREGMIAALDKQPALLMCKNGIVDAITDLAGADGGATAKKL